MATHGGKRPGAGRKIGTSVKIKPDEEIKKNRSIKFTDAEWEYVQTKAITSGFKNASEYIRSRALD